MPPLVADIEDLTKCSCFIDFIKQVEEKRKMLGLPSILLLFRNRFNKFNYTEAGMLDIKTT